MAQVISVRSDFHIHTAVSYDTDGSCTVEAVAGLAVGLGFREIGLTDHVQACSQGALGYPGQNQDTGAHEALAREVRARTWPVDVYVSWEVDYFDGGRYSFDPDRHLGGLDYVLLGHHYMGHTAGWSPGEMARYLARITMEMAREPYADIVAHPFYRSGPPEENCRILSRLEDTAVREIFCAMKEHGKAAEITAYQFHADRRCVEQMKRIYSLARETGVRFVLDSDAHHLMEVGGGLRCLNVLHELGFATRDFADYQGLVQLRGKRPAG